MSILQRVHDALQFSGVAFGLLVAVSELLGWPGTLTLIFGLVGAVAALASYFTGKHTEAAFERIVELGARAADKVEVTVGYRP